MDEVRALQQTVSEVDLIPVRPAYIRLVERLREAGMAISDRRVVRLQRVVAGSAVISGRDHAAVSDLWTLRYIWDVPAQREMLAAHVQVIVTDFSAKNEPENVANIHPLADSEQGPHPEQIALALDNISAQLNEPAVADQLALLAARVESVKNIDSREYLRLRIGEMRVAEMRGGFSTANRSASRSIHEQVTECCLAGTKLLRRNNMQGRWLRPSCVLIRWLSDCDD